jgi:type I restriction enzyme S subunit
MNTLKHREDGRAGDNRMTADMRAGWQIKTLGEVCIFDKVQGNHHGLPYVGLEHIESQTGCFIGSTEAQTVKSSTFRFSKKHVLYGRLRPYLNKVLAPDFEGHCSTEIFPLKPNSELAREYLMYWLLDTTICDQINETCTGTRMPRAQMNNVMGFDFPLPPLAEQQRIVAILDEAFEGIATARKHAEQNLQNAKALFESHLEAVFSQKGEGWVEATIGDLCTKVTDGEHIRPTITDDGTPFLSAKNVLEANLDFTDTLFVSNEDAKKFHRRCNPEQGDILIVSRGATVGRSTIVKTNTKFCLLGSVILLKVKPIHSSAFILYAIKSPKHRHQLLSASEATAQQAIYLKDIKSLSISCPTLSIQSTITSSLDALRAETNRLCELYTQKIAALDALKKSLLHQAFSGEL